MHAMKKCLGMIAVLQFAVSGFAVAGKLDPTTSKSLRAFAAKERCSVTAASQHQLDRDNVVVSANMEGCGGGNRASGWLFVMDEAGRIVKKIDTGLPISNARTENGIVVIGYLDYGPNDARCCPSLSKTMAFDSALNKIVAPQAKSATVSFPAAGEFPSSLNKTACMESTDLVRRLDEMLVRGRGNEYWKPGKLNVNGKIYAVSLKKDPQWTLATTVLEGLPWNGLTLVKVERALGHDNGITTWVLGFREDMHSVTKAVRPILGKIGQESNQAGYSLAKEKHITILVCDISN